MKNALNILLLALTTGALVSCCSSCKKSAYMPAAQAESFAGISVGKNVVSPVVTPVTIIDNSTEPSGRCTQHYSLDSACANNAEDASKRTTAQAWDGNPFIGLVPTMKPLAE